MKPRDNNAYDADEFMNTIPKKKMLCFLVCIYFRCVFWCAESNRNEKKPYMRHYVPYKPGDEFKYRTPEGKKETYNPSI